MKVGIMQPYFFPYIGYFHLISAVDIFVIYDNIKYTKKGWINRNRMLQNGKDVMFSVPLKNDSDSLDVCERVIAPDFNREKLLNQIAGAYRRAPFFDQIYPLVEHIVRCEDCNLFRFIYQSLAATCNYLGIGTEIRVSSGIAIDHKLKSQDKVLALCNALGATTYINAIGGMELYSKELFEEKGIQLKFIKSKPLEYYQFGLEFVPWLSIIDILMFNSVSTVKEYLNCNYELI